MSRPGYPNPVPVSVVVGRLADAARDGDHEFWPDDASLLDPAAFTADRIHGPGQITDAYLLALAVRHDACFVTFDAGVPLGSVIGASRRHLVAL